MTIQKPNIFSIPPQCNFIRVLVKTILNGGFPKKNIPAPDPFSLANYIIFVPTKRAAQAVAETFAYENQNYAQIMPKIIPFAASDEMMISTIGEEYGEKYEDPKFIPQTYIDDIKPELDAIGQNFILQKLLLKWAQNNKKKEFNDLATTINESIIHRIELADEMGKLFDKFAIEEKNIELLQNIKNFPTHDLAEHWQKIIPVLHIIIRELPHEIQKINKSHAVIRRNQLMRLAAQYLKKQKTPVIAAGSTGSTPATAQFLKIIANLENGAVILPGLDKYMDEQSRKYIDPQHPQFNMKSLLEKMHITYQDVVSIPKQQNKKNLREQIISEIMRPVETTHLWNKNPLITKNKEENSEAMHGLNMIAAPNQKKEATAIALIIRNTLRNPEKNVALITPNRQLAQYVIAELKRWNIYVDDSAGIPIAQTQSGIFAMLICEIIKQDFHPIPLIACLKNPLCLFYGEKNREKYKKLCHNFEHICLRGQRHPGGIAGLHAALATRKLQVEKYPNHYPNIKNIKPSKWNELVKFINKLEEIFNPLIKLSQTGSPLLLEKIIDAHIAVIENITTTPEGETHIWKQKQGAESAHFFSNLIENAKQAPKINCEQYPVLFERLSKKHIIKINENTHPRAFILGQLEARLLQHDITILGGMNEGIWPKNPTTDAWLNRPMLKMLELSSPEKFISFAAHDFVQACAKKNVYLTWAEKIQGTPASPSRWIQRLQALTNHKITTHHQTNSNGTNQNQIQYPWIQWAIGLDHDQNPMPAKKPTPKPPVKYRPRKLSITEIEKWIRDPYAIYAKHILKIYPLEKYDVNPAAAERGNIIHQAMEIFAEKYAKNTKLQQEKIKQNLIKAGKEAFSDWTEYPDIAAFWWPRFERIAQWLAINDNLIQKNVRQSFNEVYGKFTFKPYPKTDPMGNEFTLTGRADRIDILNDNSLQIIDYKTGNIPSVKQENTNFSPQLLLEAVMAQKGAFKNNKIIKGKNIAALIYIALKGGEPKGEHRKNNENIQQNIEKTFENLCQYIRAFDNQNQTYIPRWRMFSQRDESEYDQLSRFYEWGEGQET